MNYYEENDDYGQEGDDRLFDMQGMLQREEEEEEDYEEFFSLNKMILNVSLRLLENSFWWRFRFRSYKMKAFQETYQQIRRFMLSETEEDKIDAELAALEEQDDEE